MARLPKKKRGRPSRISNFGRFQNADGLKYFPVPTGLGYCYVGLKTQNRKTVGIYVHRAVHILFNDPGLDNIDQGTTVDHIDRNRANNRDKNLRWATMVDQYKNQAHNRTDRCQRIRISKFGLSVEFDSVIDAAKRIGCDSSQLSRQKTVHGWTVEKLEDPDLESEQWRPTGERHVMLSSLGRVNYRGRKYFLTPSPDGYCHLQRKPLGHRVLEFFGFPRPSKDHTVDHIDRNRSHDALSNLRWATPQEQAQNRGDVTIRRSKHIEARPVHGSEWKLYQNLKECCEETGCSRNGVNTCTNPSSRTKTAPGKDGVRYEIRFAQDQSQEDLEGEEWKELDVNDWIEGGKYYRIEDQWKAKAEAVRLARIVSQPGVPIVSVSMG
jgi:hypothetical protein